MSLTVVSHVRAKCRFSGQRWWSGGVVEQRDASAAVVRRRGRASWLSLDLVWTVCHRTCRRWKI